MTGNNYLNNAQLQNELSKCLACAKAPCHFACPAGCNPQKFINLALSGKWQEAAEEILSANPLGQVCGLICPDKFCMRVCTRLVLDGAIKIPKIQAAIMQKAYAALQANLPEIKKDNGQKVAVIGAGPAGMASAAVLSSYGCRVTLFEKENRVGGAMNLIPQSRLPQEVIAQDWEIIQKLGQIDLQLNREVAQPQDLLKQGFAGIVVAIGENETAQMGIEGENLSINYRQYLSNPKQFATNEEVAVIGGGAVAVDCAVCAKEQGANHVEMFVRRRYSDMRISAEERQRLLANEIDITTMTRICAIYKRPNCLVLETVKTKFDVDGKLQDIEGTKILRPDFRHIIMAVGGRAVRKADEENLVYAGDCVCGGSTVVEAVASGKAAAEKLIQQLKL